MEEFTEEEKSVIYEAIMGMVKVMGETFWGVKEVDTGRVIDRIFDTTLIVSLSTCSIMDIDLYRKIISHYTNGFRKWAIDSFKKQEVV